MIADAKARTMKIIRDAIPPVDARGDEFTDAQTLDEIGCDSLSKVEIVIGLEEEFNIIIPDDVGESLVTVGDVVKLVETWVR